MRILMILTLSLLAACSGSYDSLGNDSGNAGAAGAGGADDAPVVDCHHVTAPVPKECQKVGIRGDTVVVEH